jgi:hypothetical protein
VIGGHSGHNVMRSVWRWPELGAKWSSRTVIEPMPRPAKEDGESRSEALFDVGHARGFALYFGFKGS